MQVQPYLQFDGRCEEAIEFYRSALGAEVEAIMRFKDNPDPCMNPEGCEEKVMHASFRIGETRIMASDGYCKGKPDFQGFSLTITAPNKAEADRLFNALGNGGALIILGEDFGEGSSIMQERSHAFAMKSQMWLLDPRPNLPSIVQSVEDGFDDVRRQEGEAHEARDVPLRQPLLARDRRDRRRLAREQPVLPPVRASHRLDQRRVGARLHLLPMPRRDHQTHRAGAPLQLHRHGDKQLVARGPRCRLTSIGIRSLH